MRRRPPGSGASFVALPEKFAFLRREGQRAIRARRALDGEIVGRAARLGARARRAHPRRLVPGGGARGDDARAQHQRARLAATARSRRSTARSTCSTWISARAAAGLLASRRASRPATRWWSRRRRIGGVGLSVCYDLRFPELYRALAARGARCCCVPSAFTRADRQGPLGGAAARARDREPVLRARAGAVRRHSPERASHGRSLIVDPWGLVLAAARRSPGRRVADCASPSWSACARQRCPPCATAASDAGPSRPAQGTPEARRYRASQRGEAERRPAARREGPMAGATLVIRNGGFEGIELPARGRRDADRPQSDHRHHAARRGHQPRARADPARRGHGRLHDRGSPVDQRHQGERQGDPLARAVSRGRDPDRPHPVRVRP